MRAPSIVRITDPRKEAPAQETETDANGALLGFLTFYEKALCPLLEPPTLGGLSKTERDVLAAFPQRSSIIARDLARGLGIDQGYLSRILKRFVSRGLIEQQDADDRRHMPMVLTAAGRARLCDTEVARYQAVTDLLLPLSKAQRRDLASAVTKATDTLRSCAKGKIQGVST
jgi:DNA-binding MarR family transcriptional regulator